MLEAVYHKKLEVVELTLDNGIPISHQTVPEAAQIQPAEALEQLIERGWNVNDSGTNSVPLRQILRHVLSSPVCLNLLLAHSEDPNLESALGVTLLETAVLLNLPSVVEQLLKHGGNPNLDNSLPYAAERGDMPMIQLLLEHGADIKEWRKRTSSTLRK
ncbi:MAG: hypothetical protein MMC23_003138 [Stictis urceolatum]|nr:hypothetical protein [Stictis urceolata]